MKRITDAYTRALFPNRYGALDAAREHDGHPAGIAADTLDLSIAAAIYRAVSAVESLLVMLRRPARASRPGMLAAQRGPAAAPIGCG